MRTSLVEIEQIEDWLLKKGDIQDRLVTEGKILSNPALEVKAQWQMKSYDLIREYGRKKLLQEIKDVENSLFKSSRYKSFQIRIRSIFKTQK